MGAREGEGYYIPEDVIQEKPRGMVAKLKGFFSRGESRRGEASQPGGITSHKVIQVHEVFKVGDVTLGTLSQDGVWKLAETPEHPRGESIGEKKTSNHTPGN